MIPIIALNNVGSLIISLLAFIHVWRHYLKSGRQDILLGHFSAFFLFLTVFFAFSMPRLITDNGFIAAVETIVSNIALFVSLAFFIRIPLRIWGKEKWEKAIVYSIYVFTAAVFIFDIIDFHPSVLTTVGEFTYFEDTRNSVLRLLIGVMSALLGTIGGLFFLVEGVDARRGIGTRIRSVLMGVGMLFLVSAAVANYVIFNLSTAPFSIVFSASLFALIGLSLMVLGIYSEGFKAKQKI